MTPRLARAASVEALVAAPPSAVWAVVSDVTRVGEWSAECVGAQWLDGASAAVPGVRFRGRNRAGRSRWTRTCEVLAVDPGRELVWQTVPGTLIRDSTEWRPSAGSSSIRNMLPWSHARATWVRSR